MFWLVFIQILIILAGIASTCGSESAVSNNALKHTHTQKQFFAPLHFLTDVFSKKIKGLNFWHITSKNTAEGQGMLGRNVNLHSAQLTSLFLSALFFFLSDSNLKQLVGIVYFSLKYQKHFHNVLIVLSLLWPSPDGICYISVLILWRTENLWNGFKKRENVLNRAENTRLLLIAGRTKLALIFNKCAKDERRIHDWQAFQFWTIRLCLGLLTIMKAIHFFYANFGMLH